MLDLFKLLNFGAALAGLIAIAIVVIVVIGILRAWWAQPFPVFGFTNAPQQPIPFRHDLHVQKAGIQCEFCHREVTKGAAATVPSVEQCLFCHKLGGVAGATDEGKLAIQELQARFAKGDPINWVRVHRLPDHTKFQHEPHIRFFTSTDRGNKRMETQQVCSLCHGDVGKMVVVRQVKDLKMGDCVNCHRQNSAPTDCVACHY